MARMVPPIIDQDCPSPGEKDLFRRFRTEPGTEDWLVLHSLDLAVHRRQIAGEVDFVVLVPKKGVLCLEVKAARELHRSEGLWYYGTNPTPDHRGPFKQASEAMHSLRLRVTGSRSDLANMLFWSAVVFPYAEFREDSVEWHSWQVIDSRSFLHRPLRDQIEEVLDRAWAHAQSRGKFNLARPSLQQCKAIAQVLRSDFEVYESPKSRLGHTFTEVKRFTEEQYNVLDALDDYARAAFVGPAGTGKTVLAIETARRAVQVGRRVLFLCYNRFLATWLERELAPLGERAVVRTLHNHMLKIGGVPPGRGQAFWDDELPRLAIDRIIDRLDRGDETSIFDELVVDEAQDILRKDAYVDFLDCSLQGGLRGGRWRFFGDFDGQAIYGKAGLTLRERLERVADNVPVLNLQVNCRNTPRVAGLASNLSGFNYTKVRRPDDHVDPQIMVYERDEDQPRLLVSALEELQAERWGAEHIVVLSLKADGACASRINAGPWRQRLQPLEMVKQGHVGYCTVHAFKGLEAPAVVITDADLPEDDSHGLALLYIAVTRAVERLIILTTSAAASMMARVDGELRRCAES